MIEVQILENYHACKKTTTKKMLSKLEHIGVRDNCEHISTSEIENFKITDEANLFCNKPLTKSLTWKLCFFASFFKVGITFFYKEAGNYQNYTN